MIILKSKRCTAAEVSFLSMSQCCDISVLFDINRSLVGWGGGDGPDSRLAPWLLDECFLHSVTKLNNASGMLLYQATIPFL